MDIWAEYARLKSLGWTQQRVAKAKGVSQGTVSDRLKFHSMSDKVKDFIRRDLLAEFHLEEICELFAANNLSPWLTTHQVWEELAEKAVHDRAKNGSKSREKVAGILGVPKGTIARWEAEAKKDISIVGTNNTYNPPDLRIKVPKKERQKMAAYFCGIG